MKSLRPGMRLAVPIAWLALCCALPLLPGVLDAATDSPPITHYDLPPALRARADALLHTRIVQFVVGTLYGLLLLVVVLALRVAPRCRDVAERITTRRFVQGLLAIGSVLLILDLGGLPLDAWSHQLQVQYDLSVQGWGSWAWDRVKAELVSLPLTTLLLGGLYVLLRRQPRRWWFFGWLASLPIVVLLVLVWPIFVSPLFDHFEPLATRQPQLLQPLEQVMARGGIRIEPERMFEMRASDKVTTYNAYVTGIGASKRVVVWDNTARDLTIPETMFVFAHEQGHYALDHVWWSLAFMSAALLAALYIAHQLIGGVLAAWGDRWRIRGPADVASLPALLLILGLLSLLAQPVQAAFSRQLEHHADVYGLEAIHGLVPDSPQVAAHAFQKLGEKGLAAPEPPAWYVLLAYDHPSLADRVIFAANYRPWESGQRGRYLQ